MEKLTSPNMMKLLSSHGFSPRMLGREGSIIVEVFLNKEYLGYFSEQKQVMIIRDARLAAWCHIMGIQYYEQLEYHRQKQN